MLVASCLLPANAQTFAGFFILSLVRYLVVLNIEAFHLCIDELYFHIYELYCLEIITNRIYTTIPNTIIYAFNN